MCAEARETLSYSRGKRILHLSLPCFGKVSTLDSPPRIHSTLWDRNLAHFLGNVSSSHCSLHSLPILFSLLQHLSFEIAFYFHLLNRPPLCSQSSWHISQLLLLPMWKGKSQQGEFASKGLSLTTHMSWAEGGEWSLSSWKSPQATAQVLGQELC